MNQQEYTRRLWFENGFWWYRCPHRNQVIEISSLIRRESYNVTAVARELGVGSRSFHRLVKDSFGIPPGEWLRRERAVSARYRLRDGCSVKQLATEYGFLHQGDFGAEFKLWHGVNPIEYQRRSRLFGDLGSDGLQ